MKKIVIVGGGFTGTLTAINLARLSPGPLHITIVNRENVTSRGVAYSTRNAGHLLNVAARNMSALADQPNHFLEWLGTRSEYLDEPAAVLRDIFAPRKVYGDYLQQLFLWYSRTAGPEKGIQIETLQDEVIKVALGKVATLGLASGKTVEADKIVLAAGNQKPAAFRLPGLDHAHPKYIGNPWAGWEEKLPAPDQAVLLIGTGLTMVDAFISLKSRNWQGKIYAVSRNGWLPLSHFKGPEYPDLFDPETSPVKLRKLFPIFKRHYREAVKRGINPAILVDKLRPLTQRIWQNFSAIEKRRFNRHLRTRWNVTRHRIAPAIHQQLMEAIAAGRLVIFKGRLNECQLAGESFKVMFESKGRKQSVEVGAIINCTGPQESYSQSGSPLFQNLFSQKIVSPDELNMGVKVAANFAVLDQNRQSSEQIFATGPLLKGSLWETTAVPELRSQAFRLAEIIVGQFSQADAARINISEAMQEVIEYSI